MKKSLIYSIILVIAVIFISIGYSAFNDDLSISATASIAKISDVRVTGVSLDSTYNATSDSVSFTKNSVYGSITLPEATSSITYKVKITNLGNTENGVYSITGLNDNLELTSSDYTIGQDKLCDDSSNCTLGINDYITLTIKYKDGSYDSSNTSYSINLDFDFEPFYSVTCTQSALDNMDTCPSYVMNKSSLSFTYDSSAIDNLKIFVGGALTTYDYTNGIVTINDIDGDVVIKSLSNDTTNAEDYIIEKTTSSGITSSTLDLDSMSSTEKTSMFGSVVSSGDSGLYTVSGITGDNVKIYRGDISNNYFYFANMYWRVIGFDENGNVRLVLNTLSNTATAFQSSTTASTIDDASSLVDYANSNVKTYNDSWYTSNLQDYDDKIVTSKFCVNKSYTAYSSTVYYYQSAQNLHTDMSNYSPSLVCPTEYIEEYKIGLLSGEELVLSGYSYNKTATSSYLYNSANTTAYWTLSPSFWDSSTTKAGVMVDNSGKLNDWPSSSVLTTSIGIRPVITIDGNYEITGTGTYTDPYKYYEKEEETEPTTTIDRQTITDLSSLENTSFYLANIHSNLSTPVYGALSSTATSNSAHSDISGLVGTSTVTFSDDFSTLTNTSADLFTFKNGTQTSSGYTYEIVNSAGEYLTISGLNVTLSSTESSLNVTLSSDSSYTGDILISNDSGYYLNFYAAANENDDRFASWNAVDRNCYITLYK